MTAADARAAGDLEREVRTAVENECRHRVDPDESCPCDRIVTDVVRLIEAHRAQAAAARSLAARYLLRAEEAEAEGVEARAAGARVRALCERVEGRMMATAKPDEIRAALDGERAP